jgi:cytochrome c oxidase cbb3-type subunit III
MRKLAIVIVIALGSATVFLGAQNPTQANRATVAGQNLYGGHCASCHGLNGTGGESPDIARSSRVRAMSDQQLNRIIHDGLAGGMPAFGKTLSTAEIADIVGYVRYLQRGKETVVGGDIAAGKALFFGSAGCSECHMVHGQGGFIAADLTGVPLSPSDIQKALVDPGISPLNVLTTVTLRGGREVTGLVRNEDNFSIQLESLNGEFYLLDKTDVASIVRAARPLMPSDYAKRLSPAQVQDIVAYLASVAAPEPTHRRHF